MGLLDVLKKNKATAEENFNTAESYYYGRGLPNDHIKAAEFYEKAAKQGHAYSQLMLGYMYDYGDGVSADCDSAIKWYTEASKSGNHDATLNLANIYLLGRGCTVDYYKANFWLEQAANLGSAMAASSLGNNYCCGFGVSISLQTAQTWINKAEEMGYINSSTMCNLGCAYWGEALNDKEDLYENAVSCFNKAVKADANCVDASYMLAKCYYLGRGVEKDISKAFDYFTRCVELGDIDSNYYLAEIYKKGHMSAGEVTNEVKAFNYYKAGSKSRNDYTRSLCEFAVGKYLFFGECPEIGCNKEEAIKWWKNAARDGNISAAKNLAIVYREGSIVERDIVIAKSYVELCKKLSKTEADEGNSEAEAYMEWADSITYSFDDLKELALKGSDVEAANKLGDYCSKEISWDNIKESMKWYTISAKQNNLYGMVQLAFLYNLNGKMLIGGGYSVDEDQDIVMGFKEAYDWSEKAKKLPCADYDLRSLLKSVSETSRYYLGLCYYKSGNFSDSMKYLEKVEDSKSSVIKGLIMFAISEEDSEYMETYEMLNSVMDDMDYCLGRKTTLDEEFCFVNAVIRWSALFNALFESDNTGVVETLKKIKAVYDESIVGKAITELLDEELSHYQKQLLGGYTYE